MATSIAEPATTKEQNGAIVPRNLILRAGDYHSEAVLTAATEGMTRFVTSALGESGRRFDGIAAMLQQLSGQSGYSLTSDDIEVVLVSGRPLLTRVVGDLTDDDQSAMHDLQRDGTVRLVNPIETPPRSSHVADWVRSLAEQFDRGVFGLLIIAIPAGNLPDWAAQLINAVQEQPLGPDHHLIVLAPDLAIAPVLPPGAALMERDGSLRQGVADRLARIRATRLLPHLPPTARVLATTTAIAAGISFMHKETDEVVAYLDMSEGTTVVIAQASGVELLHDAACDLATGAVTLLHLLGAEEIARWVPFPIEVSALRRWAIRRVAAPHALLTDPVDRAIAGGFARAMLRAMFATATTALAPTRCIVGPGILRIGSQADALLMVADILPAPGNVAVESDADDILPIVGYFAAQASESAYSLLTYDAPTSLGAVVTPLSSHGRKSGAAVAAVLAHAKRTAIAPDALTPVAFPLATTLRVYWHDGREEDMMVRGGPSGLVMDTRVRPLRGIAARSEARDSVTNRLRASLASEDTSRD